MKRLLFLLALGLVQSCASCADFSTKKPFPCEATGDDALQCPEGWSCGLEGACFDATADAGAALSCTDSARHCAADWRCGATETDGTRRCQPVGVGGPYPCASSEDCEGDWRCDPVVRRCTEVGDQLSRSRLDAVQAEQLSPRLPVGLPSFVAVGHLQQHVSTGPSDSDIGRVVGLVSQGTLYVVTVVGSPGPAAGGRPRVEVDSYPIDEASLQQLQTLGIRVVGRFADGRVWWWDRDEAQQLLLDGGVHRLAPLRLDGPLPAANFELVALLDSELVWLTNSGGLQRDGFDAGRPLDAAGKPTEATVATQDTLAEFATWSPGSMTEAPGGLGRRALTFEPGWALRRVGLGSRRPLVELSSDAGLGWAFLESLSAGFTAHPGPACPYGTAPLQVYADTDAIEFLSRCPPEPAGQLPVARSWRVNPATSSSELQFDALEQSDAPFTHDFVAGSGELGWRNHGGLEGRAWYAEDNVVPQDKTVPALHPVLLDRAPELVTRVAIKGQVNVVALAGGYSFQHSAAGLVSAVTPNIAGSFSVLGTVANAPDLLIAPDGVYNLGVFPLNGDGPQQLAKLPTGVTALEPPAAGVMLPLSDGRRLLVVSSGDALYSADVTAQLSMDAGVNGALLPAAPLTSKLVPSPGVPIRDLALGQTTTQGTGSRALAGFFTLARDDVYAVEVMDAETFRATRIPLPTDFGPPRELWTEGGRGRVAYQRGFISALPTPVQLAPPFDDTGDVTARDFARLCGDTFALTGTTVQHYVSDAGWTAVPGVVLSPAQAEGARFWEAGPSTFLASGDGRVLELFPMRDDAGQPRCP